VQWPFEQLRRAFVGYGGPDETGAVKEGRWQVVNASLSEVQPLQLIDVAELEILETILPQGVSLLDILQARTPKLSSSAARRSRRRDRQEE